MDRISELVNQYADETVAHRRRFHQNPELSGEEWKTSAYVEETLKSMGVETKTGFAKTGIQGMIWGSNPAGKTIMLRCDMDALPIDEMTGLPFASHTAGVMHACGHDVHTAALLGAARILSEMRSELRGNVKLCFQPAEEGTGGADLMIADGIMENPKVDYAVGLHVDPTQKLGQASIEPGPISPYPNFYEYTITGRGGHGAFPNKTIDPIQPALAACSMIRDIRQHISPLEPCVVSVCTIRAGNALAVIPDQAVIGGTTRTVTEQSQSFVKKRLADIAREIEALYNVKVSYVMRGVSSPVINTPEYVEPVKECVRHLFDGGYTINESFKTGGEDFCFYGKHAPSTFILVGSANDATSTQYPLHNPCFTVDERVIVKGAETLATIAYQYLSCTKSFV